MQHFLDIADFSADELWAFLCTAKELKEERKSTGSNRPILRGKVLALIFQKPSLRTRVSFEVGMLHLGGEALYLSPDEIQLGSRESVPDVARVLLGYVDGIMARVFSHEHLLQLAQYGSITVTDGPVEAVDGADIIYTDVWASMGQEAERAERLKVFPPYQLNSRLMPKANSGAAAMHCLPAHRGEEITDEIADGPQSLLFPQAENRLHAQKAVLATLLANNPLNN